MKLTEIETSLGTVEVFVDSDGVFKATIGEYEYAARELSRLQLNIDRAVKTSKVAVPYVTLNGLDAVMRQYAANEQEILTTNENGKKNRLSRYSKVFRVGVLSEEERAELRQLHARVSKDKALIAEFEERAESAIALYNEVVSGEITKR